MCLNCFYFTFQEEIVDVSLNMGTNGDLQQVDTRKDSFKDVDKQKGKVYFQNPHLTPKTTLI